MKGHLHHTQINLFIQRVCRLALVLMMILAIAACGRSRVTRGADTSLPGTSVAQPGRSVVVRRGDTVYRLAINHRIRPRDLALWNGIKPPYTIYPGQRLYLYPGQHQTPRQTSTSRRPAQATASTRTATPSQTPPPTPIRNTIAWRWPTSGTVINRFVEGDTTRQGIDLTGRSGQPIHAAAAGEVVYSGSGLVGYGELVIVKHDEHWLSAYGHNRRRLVTEGARVQAGQTIAEMGQTGAAHNMLHFEIRYNGRPVDPLLYLPAR